MEKLLFTKVVLFSRLIDILLTFGQEDLLISIEEPKQGKEVSDNSFSSRR